jgi:LacI family transcriptional regulator
MPTTSLQGPRIALLWHAYRRVGFDAIRGISEYAHRIGPWQILFSPIADFQPEDLARRKDIDGIILFCDFAGDFWDHIKWRPKVPIVSIEHQNSPYTPYQVMPDYYATGRLVAEEFLKRGYTLFTYYPRRDLSSAMPQDVWEREQLAGFSDRVRQGGGRLLEHPVIPREWLRREHERPPAALSTWFQSLPRPVALMAGSDVRSHHVLLAAAALGLRVPEDIAVIGVDNEPWTDIASGGLSSVELDDYRAGYQAAQMLAQLMDGQPVEPKIVRVAPRRLVVRRSSDVLAINDADVVSALRFIADRAMSPIEVRDVVNASFLSRRTLERRFQNALHRTIQQEIHLGHIARAKALLEDETIPLGRVAEMSGFVSLKAMQSVFRRIVGTTPAALRRGKRAAITAPT